MDATRICSIDGCEGTYRMRRGWCNKHYTRWRIFGDPTAGGPSHFRDPEESFRNRTAQSESGCLQWTGATDSGGYGRMRLDDQIVSAHRYAWERSNGPIPEGLFVDHLCWNRACCEVGHLRLVTNKQNLENQSGPRSSSKSGIRGVVFHPQSKKWRATVRHNGKNHYFGLHATPEEAGVAAAAGRAELFTHSQN